MAMKKKDRAKDESFVAFVVEQLAGLGGVRSRSMFGGHGLYARETFFAVIDDGRLYFRVDEASRPRYLERGMGPFAPAPTMVMSSYFEVPLDVLEDAAELARWARDAVAAAPLKKSAKAAARPRRRATAGANRAKKPSPAAKRKPAPARKKTTARKRSPRRTPRGR